LAHTFRQEYSYEGMLFGQFLRRLGGFLTCWSMASIAARRADCRASSTAPAARAAAARFRPPTPRTRA
jgi:hypothetical protein